MFPPIPAWEHAHPVIVHLPIGMLAVVPLLLVSAMFARRSRLSLGVAAAIVLSAGTLGTLLATASGEAASNIVRVPAEAVKVLERHEDLAELARNMFLLLAFIYALVLGVAAQLKDRIPRAAWIATHLVYLGMYSGALVLLAHAAHEGGRLVHQFGVRAHLADSPPVAPPRP